MSEKKVLIAQERNENTASYLAVIWLRTWFLCLRSAVGTWKANRKLLSTRGVESNGKNQQFYDKNNQTSYFGQAVLI
jgi:hypothetical protein